MVKADQYIASVTLASFLFGYSLSCMGPILETLITNFQLCGHSFDTECATASSAKVLLTTMVFASAPVGCILGGSLVDRSRSITLGFTFLVYFAAAMLSVVGNLWVVTIGRFINGLAVGLSTVVCPILINEMVRNDVRGQRGIMHQLMITIGILVGVLPAHIMQDLPVEPSLPGMGGDADEVFASNLLICKVVLLVPAAVGLLGLALLWVLDFESPLIILRAGPQNLPEAKKILADIYPDKTERNEMTKRLCLDVMTEDKDPDKMAVKGQFGLANAFQSPIYSFSLCVGVFLAVCQQFVGINVFVAMSGKLFEAAGLSGGLLRASSTMMCVVNIVVTLIATTLIETAGRRAMLIYGNIAMGTCLGAAALCGTVPGLEAFIPFSASFAVISFVVFFGTTYGPVLWVYLSEIYPSEIRATAMGFCSMCNWVAGAVVVALSMFFSSPEYFGMMFACFSVACFIVALVVFLVVKETGGMATSPYGDVSVESFESGETLPLKSTSEEKDPFRPVT